MKAVLGITMGDPAGVGPEICVKALAEAETYRRAVPIVIGDCRAVSSALETCKLELGINKISCPEEAAGVFGTIDVIEPDTELDGKWHAGEESACAGEAAFQFVNKAIELAVNGEIDAVVTGPINKHAIALAGYKYSGHTEIFADKTGAKDYAMLLVSKSLRVIHVSTHVALKRACELVTQDRVFRTIKLAGETLEAMGIPDAKIAVAGLNPHCSEGGLFGTEETEEIIPAILRAREEGLNVSDPIPPDTVFVRAIGGEFDIVVAMYHDQGHIPLKLTGFKMTDNRFESVSGVNVTVGLPIIRTSVDHGTAFDIAGKGIANCESLKDAIELAAKMAESRKI